MAQSHPELHLDANGNLLDLHNKRTEKLLSPEEVAQCVKVIRLTVREEDEEPTVNFETYSGEIAGKNVNVIGGATGTGKTSLIYILAGGMQTEAKLSSDTKCPTIYILKVNGSEVAILDTAGLCDTDAEANKETNVQYLLVNAVAATIQRFKLKVVNFLMCIDAGGRLPGKFCEVWPQMQISLGGGRLGSFCHFVMTKANADSKAARIHLKKLPESEAYKQLKNSNLGWPLTTAGHDNLDEIKGLLKATSEQMDGLDAETVRADVEGLEVKRKKVEELRGSVQQFGRQLNQAKLTKEQMKSMLRDVEGDVTEAHARIASLGSCSQKRKEELAARLSKFKDRKKEIEKDCQNSEFSEESLKERLNKFQEDLQKEVEEIEEMEKLGKPFQQLSSAFSKVVEVVAGVKSSQGGS